MVNVRMGWKLFFAMHNRRDGRPGRIPDSAYRPVMNNVDKIIGNH